MISPVVVELRAGIDHFMTRMDQAEGRIHTLSKRGASSFDKLAAAGKGAFLGLGAASAVIGGGAVKAALEGELAHTRLAKAVENTGVSMDRIEPKVEALVGKYAKLGYQNDDLEAGLAVLTTALRDPEKALENIGLATDLARYKNIDLSEAALLVAKALQGQTRVLKGLGIDIPVAAGGAVKLADAQKRLAETQEDYNRKLAAWQGAHGPKGIAAAKALQGATDNLRKAQEDLAGQQVSSAQIQEALTRAVGGQAAAAAETYAGRLRAAQAAGQNLQEELGNALLPKLTAVLDKTVAGVGWFDRHRNVSKGLAVVVGGALTLAMGAYVVKLSIAVAQTSALIARTVILNTVVAAAIVKDWQRVASMNAQAGAATRLAASLTAASVAAAAMYALPIAVAAGAGLAIHGAYIDRKVTEQESAGGTADNLNSLLRRFNVGYASNRNAKADFDEKVRPLLTKLAQTNDANQRADLNALIANQLAHIMTRYELTAPKPTSKAKAPKAPTSSQIADLDRYIAAEEAAVEAARKKRQDGSAAKARAEEAKRRKAALEAAVMAERKRQQAIIDQLRRETAARDEVIRRMTVQEKLARRLLDLSLVNNNVVNAGQSFAQLATAQQRPVIVHVYGSVTTERKLTEAVGDGLRKDTRQNVTSGVR